MRIAWSNGGWSAAIGAVKPAALQQASNRPPRLGTLNAMPDSNSHSTSTEQQPGKPAKKPGRVRGGVIAAGVGAAAILAAGGYAYAGMSPSSQIFGTCVVAPDRPDEIALTYDDGPGASDTLRLLDVLARHDVRATFFLIGRFVRQYPQIARSVAAAGHLIGNHTMTHPLLLARPLNFIEQQICDCNAAIEDVLGMEVRWFRPPHGGRRRVILRLVEELGMQTVLWNAMGYDWKPTTADAVERHVLRSFWRNQLRERATNVLLHDSSQLDNPQDRSHTVAATDRLIQFWRAHFQQSGATCRFVTPEAWA